MARGDDEEEEEEGEEDGDRGDGEELASCRRCSAESALRTKKAGKHLKLWHVEEAEHERTASRSGTEAERHMTNWAQSGGGGGVEGVEGRPSLIAFTSTTWTAGLDYEESPSAYTARTHVPSRCAAAEVRLQAHDVIGRGDPPPDQLALTTA